VGRVCGAPQPRKILCWSWAVSWCSGGAARQDVRSAFGSSPVPLLLLAGFSLPFIVTAILLISLATRTLRCTWSTSGEHAPSGGSESEQAMPDATPLNRPCDGADSKWMEGNRIEDYDLDVLLRRFGDAEMRAFDDGRMEDSCDWLVAQHLVCILRGDFTDDRPGAPPLRLAG
jgi:hypothetical protein